MERRVSAEGVLGTMITIRRYSEGDEKQLRELIFPEEDRRLYTSTRWTGGFRWYRTSNVVCFEHYRRLPATPISKSKPAA
jgi:hypothetical protein